MFGLGSGLGLGPRLGLRFGVRVVFGLELRFRIGFRLGTGLFKVKGWFKACSLLLRGVQQAEEEKSFAQ